MKKAWFFLVMMGIVAAPALCLAEAPPENRPVTYVFASMDDSELARTTGQGYQFQANLKNQEGRIVIWDEWACAGHSSKADNSSFVGQVSINYGQRQATMSTGNAPR